MDKQRYLVRPRRDSKYMTINVHEHADIDAINFLPSGVEVRGYQNYDIQTNSIQFIEKDSHSWTDTQQKVKMLEVILAKNKCHSYLDFGSNLGVLVFKACMQNVRSCGIDYNNDYIVICNKILKYLNLQNANFYTDTFNYFHTCDEWDLISLMNIHHHLYGRTDIPMSLQTINKTVLKKCKWFLTQFPTELDIKAKKWTTLFKGIGPYNREAFISSLDGRECIILYESDGRPIFLIRGDVPI